MRGTCKERFRPVRTLSRVTFAVLGMACSGNSECLPVPCALPLALTVAVTSSAASGPVTGAFVQVQAPQSGSPIPCAATCVVPGLAGTYQVDIGAPGFTTVHRTAQVNGASASCGCGSVDTAHLDVALTPVS